LEDDGVGGVEEERVARRGERAVWVVEVDGAEADAALVAEIDLDG
jgi:hypothetical protein